jgi:hypothetical protein
MTLLGLKLMKTSTINADAQVRTRDQAKVVWKSLGAQRAPAVLIAATIVIAI